MLTLLSANHTMLSVNQLRDLTLEEFRALPIQGYMTAAKNDQVVSDLCVFSVYSC